MKWQEAETYEGLPTT